MVALVMLVTRAATAFSLASALATRGGASRAASASMLGGLFGLMAEPKMATPENALKGRSQKMQVAPKHYVLGTPMEGPWPEGYKVAVLANGCFWGSEKGMWLLPGEGIYSTSVGYAAGFTPNPTYEEACSGRTGHTEAMQIIYDPKKISFVDILRWFWEAHDPTAGMSQGNDVGTQYRSGAYWFDDEQKELILASKAAYEKALGRKITTECAAASDYDKYGGLYYYAENYHRASADAFGRARSRSLDTTRSRSPCLPALRTVAATRAVSAVHPSPPHPSPPRPSPPHPSLPHPSPPHPSLPHPTLPHPSLPHPSFVFRRRAISRQARRAPLLLRPAAARLDAAVCGVGAGRPAGEARAQAARGLLEKVWPERELEGVRRRWAAERACQDGGLVTSSI